MPIIYLIRCNQTQEIYIGSTIQDIKQRMYQHTNEHNNRCESKKIIDRGDYETGILQNFPDTITKRELLTREGEWIRLFANAINKIKYPYLACERGRNWDRQRNKWWRSFGSHRSSPNSNNILHISPNLFN